MGRLPIIALLLVAISLAVWLMAPLSAGAIDMKSVQPIKPLSPASPAPLKAPANVRPIRDVDLMVVPGSLKWRSPPVTGKPSTDGSFQFTVRNIGDLPTNPSVRFTCTTVSGAMPCPRQITGEKTLGQMDGAGGMNAEKTDFWPPPPAGSEVWQAGNYEIRVQAVAGRGQMEPNTGNNIQTLRFGVIGAAVFPHTPTGAKFTSPLEIKSINPQPEPPGVPKMRTTSEIPKAASPGRGAPGGQRVSDLSAGFIQVPSSTEGAITVPRNSRSVRKMPAMPSGTQAGISPSGGAPKPTSIRTTTVIPLDDGRLVAMENVKGDLEPKFALTGGKTRGVPDGSYLTRSGKTFTVYGGKVKPPPDTPSPPEDPLPDLGVALVGGDIPVVGEATAEHFTFVITNNNEVPVPSSKLSITCYYTSLEGVHGVCPEGYYFIYDFDLIDVNQSVQVLWPPDFGNVSFGVEGTIIEKMWKGGMHSVIVKLDYEGGTYAIDNAVGMGDDYTSFTFYPTVPGSLIQ